MPPDGKVRFGEIGERFELGPECLFDIDGRFDVFFRAFIDSFFFSDEFELARETIATFDVHCPATGDATLDVANLNGDVLTLNMTDEGETYELRQSEVDGVQMYQVFVNNHPAQMLVKDEESGDDVLKGQLFKASDVRRVVADGKGRQ